MIQISILILKEYKVKNFASEKKHVPHNLVLRLSLAEADYYYQRCYHQLRVTAYRLRSCPHSDSLSLSRSPSKIRQFASSKIDLN